MDYQKLNQAIEYASEMHADQRYKYNPAKFMVAHIFFVGAVLIKHGFEDDIVIAGILHDAVEDTDASIEDIEKKFGKRVAELVDAETVDQKIDWEIRQHMMQDSVRNASADVKAIKTADMLHQLNLHSDVEHVVSQKNYIETVGVEKSYWKYEKLLDAIGTGWKHQMLDDAYVLLEKMRKKHIEKIKK